MPKKGEITTKLDHLFRQESGKMVAVLCRIFGSENLAMAEDVVQDALLKALEHWKFHGIPDKPKAWLYRVARNKALDLIRKNKHEQIFDFTDPERQLLASEYTLATTLNQHWEEASIQDGFLGMMFACCDPELSQESQVTIILKTLCGFSTKEVARMFICSEAVISKRLYRTKEHFRSHKNSLKIPREEELLLKLDAVLAAIYLIFNEGYLSTHSQELVREDLISQALFLGKALLDHQKTNKPEVNALMALMCFHSSRSDSRVSDKGELVLLADQDRSSWNQELISIGRGYLEKSIGDSTYTYQLEALIAFEHCRAQSYANTNWTYILAYYDLMLKADFNPVVYLSRCLVIMELKGPEQALADLARLESEPRMQKYFSYHAAMAELYSQTHLFENARLHYLRAIELTHSGHEKRFIEKKLKSVLTKTKSG